MKSLDDRAAELAKSQHFGDIRIPMDIAARLRKGAEKKESMDGVDLDKIRAQKDGDDKEDGDEKKSDEPKKEDSEESYAKSFHAVETGTLQKARLQKIARVPDPFFVKVGKWISDSLVKSDIGTLRKAVAAALPDYQHEAKGKTLVAGLPEPKALSEGDNDPKILKINEEIANLQVRMCYEGSDPFDQSVIFNQLQATYERLAEAVMNSMGLGLKTEDLIAEPTVQKSQADDKPITIPENTTGKDIIVSL